MSWPQSVLMQHPGGATTSVKSEPGVGRAIAPGLVAASRFGCPGARWCPSASSSAPRGESCPASGRCPVEAGLTRVTGPIVSSGSRTRAAFTVSDATVATVVESRCAPDQHWPRCGLLRPAPATRYRDNDWVSARAHEVSGRLTSETKTMNTGPCGARQHEPSRALCRSYMGCGFRLRAA